jgi:hypothetical protein
MGASVYKFSEICLEDHWKTLVSKSMNAVMYSTLQNSGHGSGLDVDWHGWMIVHSEHGFYARVYMFTRKAFFPAPHLAVSDDNQREIEVRSYSELEIPYAFTMPADMFTALCDMPLPADFSATEMESSKKWREMHKKHSGN